jgi:hypothetical protein
MTVRQAQSREEPGATKRFEEEMRALFQAPKVASKKKKKDKPTALTKKPKSSDQH